VLIAVIAMLSCVLFVCIYKRYVSKDKTEKDVRNTTASITSQDTSTVHLTVSPKPAKRPGNHPPPSPIELQMTHKSKNPPMARTMFNQLQPNGRPQFSVVSSMSGNYQEGAPSPVSPQTSSINQGLTMEVVNKNMAIPMNDSVPTKGGFNESDESDSDGDVGVIMMGQTTGGEFVDHEEDAIENLPDTSNRLQYGRESEEKNNVAVGGDDDDDVLQDIERRVTKGGFLNHVANDDVIEDSDDENDIAKQVTMGSDANVASYDDDDVLQQVVSSNLTKGGPDYLNGDVDGIFLEGE